MPSNQEMTAYSVQKLLDELDLQEVQHMVDKLLGKDRLAIMETLKEIMRGNIPFGESRIGMYIRTILSGKFQLERYRLERLMLLIVFAAVFHNISTAFGHKHTDETGFYVVYMLLFTTIMDHFSELSQTLASSIQNVADFMKSLAPSYFLVLTASTGTTTAMLFYQGVLLLAGSITWLLLHLILPLSDMYVLLCLINTLSKEKMLSRLAELIKILLSWGLHTMLSIVLGLQVVKSLIAPVIDTLKRSALGRTASALPGVGNAINSVTELLLCSAVLVRNSLGIVFLIILVLFGSSPLIHYLFLSFSYRFLAAVSEPVSDARLIGALGSMGEGCAFLMRIFLTMELMCALTLLVLMTSFGGASI